MSFLKKIFDTMVAARQRQAKYLLEFRQTELSSEFLETNKPAEKRSTYPKNQ